MILNIDTSKKDIIHLSISNKNNILAEKDITVKYSQGEKILLEIEKMLKEFNFELREFKKIKVNNKGNSFTNLRSSVVIANALGYFLDIPIEGTNNKEKKSFLDKINIIKPHYNKEPHITMTCG